jgi:hypothetical protein
MNLGRALGAQMTLKRGFPLLIAVLAGCIVAGCTAQPPIKRDRLIGTYVYKSLGPEGGPSDHEWDRLTLQASGRYDLVEGGPTKAKSEKTGAWYFTPGEPGDVTLDHAGYPVHIEHGEVRLMIDDDVGIWYAKPE